MEGFVIGAQSTGAQDSLFPSAKLWVRNYQKILISSLYSTYMVTLDLRKKLKKTQLLDDKTTLSRYLGITPQTLKKQLLSQYRNGIPCLLWEYIAITWFRIIRVITQKVLCIYPRYLGLSQYKFLNIYRFEPKMICVGFQGISFVYNYLQPISKSR